MKNKEKFESGKHCRYTNGNSGTCEEMCCNLLYKCKVGDDVAE